MGVSFALYFYNAIEDTITNVIGIMHNWGKSGKIINTINNLLATLVHQTWIKSPMNIFTISFLKILPVHQRSACDHLGKLWSE